MLQNIIQRHQLLSWKGYNTVPEHSGRPAVNKPSENNCCQAPAFRVHFSSSIYAFDFSALNLRKIFTEKNRTPYRIDKLIFRLSNYPQNAPTCPHWRVIREVVQPHLQHVSDGQTSSLNIHHVLQAARCDEEVKVKLAISWKHPKKPTRKIGRFVTKC